MVTGVVLALAASGCWAALDAQRKALATELGPLALVAWMAAGQTAAFGAWWGIAGGALPTSAYWAPGVAVLVANLVASVGFVAAVRASPLSLTIPMLAFTPALATAAAAALLGELPSAAQIAGIAAVVVGALGLHAGAVEGGPVAWARALVAERGSRWMLGVAALWGVTGALDKVGLADAAVPVHGALQSGAMAIALVAALALRGELGALRAGRGRAGRLAALVATSVLAVGLQYLAILAWYVSLVEATKRAVGLVASVASGRVVFGEPVTVGKLGGIAVMTAGVAAIVLG